MSSRAMRTCCKAFNQHSNVERAQCAVSTRGSQPMKKWERVKKRGGMRRGGGWNVFRERDREKRERERDPWYTSTNRRTHKKRPEKKTGHIPQAPENVLVILGRVLLIDERGVFKPLPLWSWFNSDCTWQAAECFGTFVIFRSPIQWYLTTAWHHKVHRRKDERSVSVGVIWIKKKICSNFL